MSQFICKKDGFIYYDPILSTWVSIDNNLLFIIGYSRSLCDSRPSNRLTIPSFFVRNSVPIRYVEDDVRRKIKEYLSMYYSLNHSDSGYYIETFGLSNVLDSIGLVHFYETNTKSYRPHVPLFLKRSCDYNLISLILNNKEYYSDIETPYDGLNCKYTVINKNNSGYKYIDPYKSFGSETFIKYVLYNDTSILKNIESQSSYFIWNLFAFDQLYHFSLGVLYGLVQLGYGILPFTSKPSSFLPSDTENIYLYDEAHFWFHNADISEDCVNGIFELDRQQYKYDTFPITGLRIGVTNHVGNGSLHLCSKYVWGYNLNTKCTDIDIGVMKHKIECYSDNTENDSCNVEDYDGSEIPSKDIESIAFISGKQVSLELNNIIKDIQFSINRLPKENDSSNNELEVHLSRIINDITESKNNTSFIISPKAWSYSTKIRLPKKLYRLGYNGSIEWNTKHPLFSFLYGKEFSVIYDDTKYVDIYSKSSQTNVLYSSVQNMYHFNGHWMNESELNAIGWFTEKV